MTNTKSKISIDILLCALFIFTLETGLILKCIGKPFGRHGVNTLLGLTRRDWCDLHILLCMSFLILLIVHIYQHSKFIVTMLQKNMLDISSKITLIITAASLIATMVYLIIN